MKALLATRIVTDDDVSDLADLVGVGGVVVTSLRSYGPGQASQALADLVRDCGHVRIGLIAVAESGDHERLRRLYARFGFESVYEWVPSLMVRPADL